MGEKQNCSNCEINNVLSILSRDKEGHSYPTSLILYLKIKIDICNNCTDRSEERKSYWEESRDQKETKG